MLFRPPGLTMRCSIVAVCLAVGLIGCSRDSVAPTPTSPSPTQVPSPPPPPPPPAPPPGSQNAQVIAIGERVHETLIGHGSNRLYDITATADGTLQMHITFERKQGLIEVWVDDKPVISDDDGELIAEVAVRAGRTYRFWVGDGAGWDYGDWALTFELTTSLR
jgi:hypothetical protein